MRAIKGLLTKDIEKHVDGNSVSKRDAYPVSSFRALVEHVARLSYLNKDYLLFFRGQEHDYRNKAGATTIYPKIYRGEYVSRDQLQLSFSVLDSAASNLCNALKNNNMECYREVSRRKYIQWSILQHYEVCPTPLLDITQSLRVACSFAYFSGDNGEPYVYVLGLPYYTNRISLNTEHDLVNIRLLSICPPEALRPYYQEGFVTGTDEVSTNYDSKTELDFNNRLIAKFQLVGEMDSFWGNEFGPYSKSVLFPSNDKFLEICDSIGTEIEGGPSPSQVGAFLEQWTELESWMVELARSKSTHKEVYSVGRAVQFLHSIEVLDTSTVVLFDEIRKTRNMVVHKPKQVKTEIVIDTTTQMRAILEDIRLIDQVKAKLYSSKKA